MFEQITLKDKNISEKALHLSLQKIYSHKQGNSHSLDRSEVAGSGKKLFVTINVKLSPIYFYLLM